MTLEELKERVRKYIYLEDEAMLEVFLAANIANRLKLGNPVWLLLVGPSSSGKTQLIRPLALSDERFIHSVDELTENTFLSGAQGKVGEEMSLLKRIGSHGILAISDLTVLFSMNSETLHAILGKLRAIYDGELSKSTGNKSQIVKWKGYLGVIGASTPSIYAGFEQVSDMGERFLCYRMHPYNETEAAWLALTRGKHGREMDEDIAEVFREYIKKTVTLAGSDESPLGRADRIVLTDDIKRELIRYALFAERLRTQTAIDRFTKDIERIPIPAMPARTVQQLSCIAKALFIMKGELSEKDMHTLAWIGWSLANEEKRAVLGIIAKYITTVTETTIANTLGLETHVTRSILQSLAASGVIKREKKDKNMQFDWSLQLEPELVRLFTGSRAELIDENGSQLALDDLQNRRNREF